MTKTWKHKALAATQGSQFGAILHAATGTEKEAPAFTGKAIVTSDGFVQANFVGKDGRAHHGAFVGSLVDLRDNTLGLAAQLKLAADDRRALFAAVHDWVAVDYSDGCVLKTLVVAQ